MSDAKQQHDITRLRAAFASHGVNLDDVFTDAGDFTISCTLSEECRATSDLTLTLTDTRFACSACGASGNLSRLADKLEAQTGLLSPPIQTPEPASHELVHAPRSSPALKVERNLAPETQRVAHLDPKDRILTPEELQQRASEERKERRKGLGERLLIGGLALLFLIAGLMAATLSGYANFQAFSTSVADPLQAKIWGWTGVIAAIVSFGGFTFVYWHAAARRMKESLRAALFALAGAATSIIGTSSYIEANNTNAALHMEQAGTNRTVLNAQIADWRTQLGGIPPETRSVDGLEIYIAEVDRVGRSHQKPYRDAQNELGLAKRRDELLTKIDAANEELLGTGPGAILTRAEQRTHLPPWFFAVMLELFSSQGTSIGLVAFLILLNGSPARPAGKK